jgi:hypothetical protein
MVVNFINQDGFKCGVSDYGQRLFDILKKSKKNQYIQTDDLSVADVNLFNYHFATMPNLKLSDNKRNVILHHEGGCSVNCKVIEVASLPRPVKEIDFPRQENKVTTIGSFGFGFSNKNFYKIAEMVKNEFASAKIRVNIPYAYYGDYDGILARQELQKMQDVLVDSNIEFEVSHEYLKEDDLIEFLSMNDINLFLFNEMKGRGLSSSIDYALASKRPIGISRSDMFRHLTDVSSSIFVDENTIQELIDKGTEPLNPIYEKNTNQTLIDCIDNLIL